METLGELMPVVGVCCDFFSIAPLFKETAWKFSGPAWKLSCVSAFAEDPIPLYRFCLESYYVLKYAFRRTPHL